MLSSRIAPALIALALLALPSAANAQAPVPIPDLGTVIQGLGTPIPTVTVQNPPAPSYDPAPPAPCAPGAKPQPSVDGRVPAGGAANGPWGNPTMGAPPGAAGGVQGLRGVDPAGHEGACYDTPPRFPA